ncbi:MAG: DUF4344 domain-containing metallopeptidase [Actinomycetia bacterium]|nr:DUF4344 domain-containing metallopeptidase [Actinomycetes bacterium]
MQSDNPHTRGLIDWVKESGRLDRLVRVLNSTYVLPEDIHVYVQEIGEPNAFYSPGYRAIVMAPELLDMILGLFNREYRWDNPDDASNHALQAVEWIFLHEAGHALIDVLDIPITGLEEDAADQFATMTMLRLDRPWPAYSGAILFRALAQNRGGPGATDYWDEHALHEQRDTNILCWLYGYDPFEFVFIPTRFPDATDRIERCGAEYQQVKSSWQTLLAPHAKWDHPRRLVPWREGLTRWGSQAT